MYTRSKDGQLRTNLHVTYRVTKEERDALATRAKAANMTLKKFLRSCLIDGLYADEIATMTDYDLFPE